MSFLVTTVLGGVVFCLAQGAGAVDSQVSGKASELGPRVKAVPREGDEKALRERVLAFYTLLKDGKIMAANEFVAVDSKDLFLAGEKPKPDSLMIEKLEWLEAGEQAKVSLVGETSIFVAGKMLPSRTVFDSYWKRVGRRWMYFDPPVRERKTPFGIVRVDRGGKALAGSTVDLKAKVAESLAKTAIGKGIEVDVKDVEFSLSKSGTASFKVANGADGYINVIFGGTDVQGLEFSPANASLAPGQAAEFILKWTPGATPVYGQDWGALILQPINRRHQFKIRWND